MVTASATLSPATFTAATATVSGPKRKSVKVRCMTGLCSFGGLKAHNSVSSLGLPVCTEQSFAKVASSLKGKGRGGGGALCSTCSNVEEIFSDHEWACSCWSCCGFCSSSG